MRSKNRPDGQSTFVEKARRRQIIDATVTTVARDGFAAATLSQIAVEAGVSKGLISYHFADKRELMIAVVGTVGERVFVHVHQRLDPASPPAERLRALIIRSAAYGVDHWEEIVAFGDIVLNLRDADGTLHFTLAGYEASYAFVASLVRAGQRDGSIGTVDARVFAITFQSAIDAMFGYKRLNPEHDLAAHAEALADLLVDSITNPRRTP